MFAGASVIKRVFGKLVGVEEVSLTTYEGKNNIEVRNLIHLSEDSGNDVKIDGIHYLFL